MHIIRMRISFGIFSFRLPTDHPSLTKWSAPLFVDINLQGGGLAFGKQERSVFSVCTTDQLEKIIFNENNPGTRSLGGIEFAFSCGSAVSEKTDVVSIPFGSELDLVSVSRQSGAIVGFSFLCTCCCILYMFCYVWIYSFVSFLFLPVGSVMFEQRKKLFLVIFSPFSWTCAG